MQGFWQKKWNFKNSILLIVGMCLTQLGQAQSNTQDLEPRKKGYSKKMEGPSRSKSNSLSDVAQKAEMAFEEDDAAVAASSFVRLGDELSAKGAYEMAETNYKRAVDILKKSKSATGLAEVQRKLAKAQEELNKPKEAIANYSEAAFNQDNVVARDLNRNDMKRMQTPNLEQKEAYARRNVEMLTESPVKATQAQVEMTDALTQLANTQRLQQKSSEALNTLSKAVAADKESGFRTEQAAEDLTKALVKDHQWKAAIDLQNQLLQRADSSNNMLLKINALTQLGNLYAQQKQDTIAERHFLAAYNLATAAHLTKASKGALEELVAFYNRTGRASRAQQLSNDFIQNLDELLTKDSSLLDMKVLELTEKRIQKLEQEKALQARIIQQSQRNNYLLATVAAVVLLSLLFLGKAYFGILKRNKKIRLQSLRREMNPHFVFNSLNSVNQFIAENDEIRANKYLSAYSTLMRSTMEQSGKDFVPLAVELDHLNKYLALEHQRFSHQFDYKISVDENIDQSEVAIPNMIIQPFLENAVWHGLRYKQDKGLLTLQFLKKEQNILIEITDNGIGITQSKALKTNHQKQYKSLGMDNTKERIALLNQLYQSKIHLQITDLTTASGTIVSITLPIQKYTYEAEHH